MTKITLQTREKMRLAKLGKKRSPHTEETKLKMSIASKGKPKSDEHKKALSIAFKGRIEAHHILSWKNYPELRYIINNGITLCHAHHPRKRAEESRLSPFFQELINQES